MAIRTRIEDTLAKFYTNSEIRTARKNYFAGALKQEEYFSQFNHHPQANYSFFVNANFYEVVERETTSSPTGEERKYYILTTTNSSRNDDFLTTDWLVYAPDKPLWELFSTLKPRDPIVLRVEKTLRRLDSELCQCGRKWEEKLIVRWVGKRAFPPKTPG